MMRKLVLTGLLVIMVTTGTWAQSTWAQDTPPVPQELNGPAAKKVWFPPLQPALNWVDSTVIQEPHVQAVWQSPLVQEGKKQLTHPASMVFQKVADQPVPAVAVIPVYDGSRNRAFSDIAMVFAQELASTMQQRMPQSTVFVPDSHKALYQSLIQQFVHTRRPAGPTLTTLLSDWKPSAERPIERIILVEASVDTTHPERPASMLRPSGVRDRFRRWMTDDPVPMQQHVSTRVSFFDVSQPGSPMLFSTPWHYALPQSALKYPLPSIAQSPMALQTFGDVSRLMANAVLLAAPRRVYQHTSIDTQVSGELISPP